MSTIKAVRFKNPIQALEQHTSALPSRDGSIAIDKELRVVIVANRVMIPFENIIDIEFTEEVKVKAKKD